jgi:hypothetical protein
MSESGDVECGRGRIRFGIEFLQPRPIDALVMVAACARHNHASHLVLPRIFTLGLAASLLWMLA